MPRMIIEGSIRGCSNDAPDDATPSCYVDLCVTPRPTDPMTVRRILMISSLWPPVVLGGAESYASALAEQLRARGGEVGVLTFGVGGADVVSTVSPWPYRLEAYASTGAAS